MAKLTSSKRAALPKSDFAIPGKRAYPLDTANRARNALARGAQNASPAEQAEIKKKVKAKFPSINVGGKSKERGGERGGGRKMVTVPASRAAARERRR